ncbi:MAG: fused MFS/spermidine synthase [Chloroflexota bacterium]|nr:fused MFS/spermidine synthase [Chloroflexota bacterium]
MGESILSVFTRQGQTFIRRPLIHRASVPTLLLVFTGGVNLILIQWVLVKEMTTLLLGTELIILLVSVSYFAGVSVGYALARDIRRTWLVPLALMTLVLHLTLPIWFRLIVTGLTSINAYGAAFLLLPLLAPFVVSAFYSVFLPLFVDGGDGTIGELYAAEIAGSISGILILVVFGGFGLQTVYTLYSVSLVCLLFALGVRTRWLVAAALFSSGWLIALPALNFWSNTRWYQQIHGLPDGSQTLFSQYSPYQKVDVIETPDGTRYLFLDGLSHFDSSDNRLNVMMGDIPARLLSPTRALVLGAGAMQTEQMIAAHNAERVTTVEIDPVVVEAGVRYFAAFNQMDTLTNRQVVIDDAKHFIAASSEGYDLIVTDVPAAYSIQSAYFYSITFYEALRHRLTPNGIVAVNLTSPFSRDDPISRRIVASLFAVYNDVIVITPGSVGWSVAYAADRLPFTSAQVEASLRDVGETDFIAYQATAVRALVGDAAPITLNSLEIVLDTSLRWIRNRIED